MPTTRRRGSRRGKHHTDIGKTSSLTVSGKVNPHVLQLSGFLSLLPPPASSRVSRCAAAAAGPSPPCARRSAFACSLFSCLCWASCDSRVAEYVLVYGCYVPPFARYLTDTHTLLHRNWIQARLVKRDARKLLDILRSIVISALEASAHRQRLPDPTGTQEEKQRAMFPCYTETATARQTRMEKILQAIHHTHTELTPNQLAWRGQNESLAGSRMLPYE